MKKPPTEVQLSREEGEALMQRLEGDRLTGEDRRVLGLLVQWYFWLGFALRETKIGLKRLKARRCLARAGAGVRRDRAGVRPRRERALDRRTVRTRRGRPGWRRKT